MVLLCWKKVDVFGNNLFLSEDAMLIYRTSRAPERRVFKVFVGNMDDKDVEPYVNELQISLRETKLLIQRMVM